ncbi:hypothetical protein ACOI1H_18490 [Loktanella sp. DJP18]|uniref:hypothetical protein n=1 Tax=Loktanella sp. DJP18 TaxID=3409788 RepID=UPI003BB4EC89
MKADDLGIHPIVPGPGLLHKFGREAPVSIPVTPYGDLRLAVLIFSRFRVKPLQS